MLQNKYGLLLLLAVEAFLLALFPPSLVFNSSLIAGGDTSSHFLAVSAFRESILSGSSPFSWIYGNYAGFPIFLNYFPFPFFIVTLLSFCIPLTIAFKLVTILPVLMLPLAVYACLRKFGQRDFICGVGSALTLPFITMKGNAMWGGNISSMLAGEFCYGISLALAVYLTGKIFSDISRRKSLFTNSFLEALIALSSGYPLLQIGFGSSYFLFRRRFLPYLISMHLLSFGMISFWILPLLLRLPWDTPFNHAWRFEGWGEPMPPALLPAMLGIVLGWSTRLWRCEVRSGEQESEDAGKAQEFLWWNIAVASLFFALGPAVGLVDIRFLPFAHVYLILLGAIGWGKVLARLRYSAAWACVLVLAGLAGGAANIEPISSWIRWNYSGFEAKPLWEPFESANLYLKGDANSPRVMYEHAEITERAGTVRAFELLPYFSGRSTLEGLYMQSSISSPFIFYLQSELSQAPSCPFPGYCYSRLDPGKAAGHLRLFNVGQVIAATEETASLLDRSPEYRPEMAFPPYRIYTVLDSDPTYIVPLRLMPCRIPSDNWKQTQFDWFRKSSLDVPLVVVPKNGEGAFWRDLPAFDGNMDSIPKVPLPDFGAGEVSATAHLEKNKIVVDTSFPNHPLWLKVSYHPDWRVAEGEGEIYLASPAFMLVVPHTSRIVLRFDTTGGIYATGNAVTLITWIFVLLAVCLKPGSRLRRSAEGHRPSSGILCRLAALRVPKPDTNAAPVPAVSRDKQSGCPSISPVVWLLLVLIVCGSLWRRDERDPILLYDKALRIYESAERVNPINRGDEPAARPDPRARADLAKARELFLTCLGKYPLSPVVDHAAHYAVLTYMLEQKWSDAVAFYGTYLSQYPDTRIYPEALYDLGVCSGHLNEPETSRRYFWQVLTFYPDSGLAVHAATALMNSTGADELLAVAREYFDQGDFARACPLLDALSSGQASPAVQAESTLLAAYCRFYQNRWDQAARLFTDYLNGYPGHPAASKAFITLGQCYLFMGRYKEAKSSLTSALTLDPGIAHKQPFSAIMRTVEDLDGSEK